LVRRRRYRIMLNNLAAINGAKATYSQVVLADNPIGFWLLNETSGTTGDDLTANNNDLTFYNSPTLNVATGLTGITKAITFDGTNDRLQTSTVSTFNIASSSNWSMEIWIKTNSATFGTFLGWRDATGTGAGITGVLTINNGTAGLIQLITTDNLNNNLIISHAGSYNDNAWHQIVVSATAAGTLRLYVDGVDRANSTTSRNSSTSNRFIIVGANDLTGTPGQFYPGTATAVSVYNTALSAGQVLSHYNAGV
jgi:hypothetical protein